MNRRALHGFILATLLSVLSIQAQEPIQITFDAPPEQRPGTSIFVQEYYERGMWFRPLGVVGPGNGFSLRTGGGQLDWAPDNRTTYAAAPLTASLSFSFVNNMPFDLLSVDLAEYSTAVPDAITVPFFGYRQDGTVVSAQFTTDGVIDGIGPLPDFERFYFGPEFSGLTRVEIPSYGWSLDNVVVAIPEPSTTLLLLAGGLLVFHLHRRKTWCLHGFTYTT